MQPPYIHRDRSAILLWLACCALLVASMVVLGGYTRLSGSGLSITQWRPMNGTLPPLNDTQWQEQFQDYKRSPQYQKVNTGMSVEEFKGIFWPEFLHRLLGRAVGAVFFLPLIAFSLRRSLSRRFVWRLAGIFALGGLQGLIGWLMVKSGLVDNPHVSHIRLALHLSVAFAIFAMLLWALLDVMTAQERERTKNNSYVIWFALLCLQIILGAFMAGLHGGLVYNTWPDMDGRVIADGAWALSPWYLNLLENITLIQFAHRTLAIVLVFGFLLWWFLNRVYVKNKHLGKECSGVTAIIGLQLTLGVVTLLRQAPLDLALAHQTVALLLFAAGVKLLYKLSHDL